MLRDVEVERTWILSKVDSEGLTWNVWKHEGNNKSIGAYIRQLIDRDFREYYCLCTNDSEKKECFDKREVAYATIAVSDNEITGDARCINNLEEEHGFRYTAVALDSLEGRGEPDVQ